MAEAPGTKQFYEAYMLALRDAQNNIDGLKSPMAIRRVLAGMVQQTMGFLDAAERQTRPPTPR